MFGELLELRNEVANLGAELANLKYELSDEIYNKGLCLRFPIVKSKEETLDALLSNDCSIARYGDAEFVIAFGESYRYQEHSPELARRLRAILVSDNPPLLVGIPNLFGCLTQLTPRSRSFWRRHFASYRSAIYDVISFEKTYYDSLFSRPYISFTHDTDLSGYFEKVRQIWKGKEVILIEGQKSRVGTGNDLLVGAASVRRILGPVTHAFRRYDDLYREATKQPTNVLFLLALGPTATVLAHDLAKDGYRALDIGHIDVEYEWFCEGEKLHPNSWKVR